MSRPAAGPSRTSTGLGTSARQPSNPSGTAGQPPRRSAGPLPGLARAASALRQHSPAPQQSALLSIPAHLRASTAPRIPSPLGRGTPSKPQPKQSFPVRTSKLTQKHVLLPEEIQTRPLHVDPSAAPAAPPPGRVRSPNASSSGSSSDGQGQAPPAYDEHERTEAEKMSKAQRQEAGLPRLTAYATAESYRIKLLQAFLKREHGVGVVRVFDDAVYAVYTLPLLPGYGAGTKVRSSPAVKSPGGVSLLERMTEAEEVGYHDGFFPQQAPEDGSAPDHTHSNEYLLSTSPNAQTGDDTARSPENATFDGLNPLPTVHEEKEPRTGESSPVEPDTPNINLDENNNPIEGLPILNQDLNDSDPSPQEHLRISREAALRAKNEDEDRKIRKYRDQYRRQRRRKSSSSIKVGEVVFFEYGVTVFFGLTEREERDILEDCESAGVWSRPLKEDDWEVEECHHIYDPDADYPRIYNDMFTFKSHSHLLKLSVSHAIAQSTKLSVYESVMQESLASTASFPKELAETGELSLARKEALKMTGRLFTLRMDVNLSSGILDTPDLFWSEASLLPLYEAIRDYLEIGPRVQVLNDRLAVSGDLLVIIHEYIDQGQMNRITWIVIILIIIAVVVAFGEVTARIMFYRTEREKGQSLLLYGVKAGLGPLLAKKSVPMAEYIAM
ncbi:hypothetical protein FFLO_00628 [Filobasidium floriforme]|uniref:DUF155 domain-containing protein n=1 Tax=Filobasidium floriforme TaxID=5210 RepID=A0A8K0JSQ4_9TREE|nr:hypothetical protein FFLO_00628 [Filobasidium floriforme]